MRAYSRTISILLATSLALFSLNTRAGNPEIDALRAELLQMRNDYEIRIRALEARLIAAENKAEVAVTSADKAVEQSTQSARKKPTNGLAAFNPAIGLTLVGSFRAFDEEQDFAIPGFALGEETGFGEEGFSLGESELNIQANIDDKFFGNLTAALASEDGETEVELEEAWVQTTALPAGLTARFGRMFSDLGYLNNKHVHTDHFVDRPLPYRAFLGNQYGDDGIRLSWIAPTDQYIELGGEWFRGEGFPAGGARNQGKGAHNLFVRTGGDVGSSNSWIASLSRLHAQSDARSTGEDTSGDGSADVFSGDIDLWVASMVWKWAPNGNRKAGFLDLQAEFFSQQQEGAYFLDPIDTTLAYDERQTGWYAQGFYQFSPGWRVGLRHAELRADDPGATFAGTVLDRLGHDPMHDSAVLEWSNSEFSKIRLQFNHDRSQRESDNQLMLQYIMNFGAHAAHKY